MQKWKFDICSRTVTDLSSDRSVSTHSMWWVNVASSSVEMHRDSVGRLLHPTQEGEWALVKTVSSCLGFLTFLSMCLLIITWPSLLASRSGISRACVPRETQGSGVFLCISTAIKNDQPLSYWTNTDLVYLKRKLNWDVNGWSWQRISSHRKGFESLLDLSTRTGFSTSCLISFGAY